MTRLIGLLLTLLFSLSSPVMGANSDFGRLSFAPKAGGALDNAAFTQKTFSQTFSSGGRFAGQTIDDVAAGLRSGAMKPADVPIEFIVRDGNSLILNTRSVQALQQAGIPRSAWNAIDMTGDAAAQARLSGQLQRNGLTSQGILNPTGR